MFRNIWNEIRLINKIIWKIRVLGCISIRLLNMETFDCQIFWLLNSTKYLSFFGTTMQEKADVAAQEADSAKAAWICRVCLSAEVNMTLVPCGHVLCRRCSSAVSKCPFCRLQVTKTMRIFRPWQPQIPWKGGVFLYISVRDLCL